MQVLKRMLANEFSTPSMDCIKVLVGHHHGYTEFDIATGKIVNEFKLLAGATAVRRQPNGHTIIAGVNLAGITGVVILELAQTTRGAGAGWTRTVQIV
jgi:hypothetical protein